MKEENLIGYSENWKALKVGDNVITENLQNIAYVVGKLNHSVVLQKGATQVWKIIKKENLNGRLYFTGKNEHHTNMFDENTCDENDTKTLMPSVMVPLGAKVKYYIQKEKPLTDRIILQLKNIFKI